MCAAESFGGAPFVKLSVGTDKMLFMYYQVDREKQELWEMDGHICCLCVKNIEKQSILSLRRDSYSYTQEA